jgi:hypothetical protein
MSWSCGADQLAYVIARFGTSNAVLPLGGALPPTATSFRDLTHAALDCYTVVPLGGSPVVPVANSDVLCSLPNVASVFRSPQNFAIRLNESNSATLTWSPPFGGHDSYILVVLGAGDSGIPLGGGLTATSQDTGGIPRCYLLLTILGGNVVGNSNAACALPGLASFPPV